MGFKYPVHMMKIKPEKNIEWNVTIREERNNFID
jgi:hypothetical protein